MLDETKKIINEIKVMVDKDQSARKGGPEEKKRIPEIDTMNRTRIKEIVLEHGLISVSKFGKEASSNAWLLIQHFPEEEIEFMEMYLNLMRQSLDDIDLRNHAYLRDRINLYKGVPQVYGTQLVVNESGKQEFHKIENIREIDTIRKRAGLESLSDYAKKFDQKVELPQGYKRAS